MDFRSCRAKIIIKRQPDRQTRQAVIPHQRGGFYLQDAGSRNGTFVNDEFCDEVTPLLVGDTIRFGKYVTLRVG